jgi:transposase-like protein
MNNPKGTKRRVSPKFRYSEAFKQMVVSEYERGFLTKIQLKNKYDIGGKSRVLDWCRRYGKLNYEVKVGNIVRPMKDPQKRRIQELERQLEEANLTIVAYKKLIEIAEREEGINILKKSGTKQ